MSEISPTTASLCLQLLRSAWARGEARRNGADLSPAALAKVRVAVDELNAVVDQGGDVIDQDTSPSGHQVGPVAASVPSLVSVAEAAIRLGCTPRTVRRRVAAGGLSARRLDGRTLAILWRADDAVPGDRSIGAVPNG